MSDIKQLARTVPIELRALDHTNRALRAPAKERIAA
jgi:hypothetical protein